MTDRRVLIYFAWSRPAELDAPLTEIDDRYPALFELRRALYPLFEPMSDPDKYDQGIAGFIDGFLKPIYTEFVTLAKSITDNYIVQVERVLDDGTEQLLDWPLLESVDTLVVVGSDSLRTEQHANAIEIDALRRFLDDRDRVVFLCPHHNIGDESGLESDEIQPRQEAEHLHHGDKTIPPRQGFGGFIRSLLSGLGVPVENRFGLHPAVDDDGSPAAIEVDRDADRLKILDGVTALNKHPHLPHLMRVGDSLDKLDVLARQRVDPGAPPHPVFRDGNEWFDSLLQSRPDVFAGTLLVSDTTLFSSTFGGVDNLKRFWTNIVGRQRVRPLSD
jgi:hypothetical protein